MKRRTALSAVLLMPLLFPDLAEAKNRKGSRRVGGTTSHGKGARYVGGRRGQQPPKPPVDREPKKKGGS